MKIFILIVVMVQSSVMHVDGPPTWAETFSSAESAAIYLYEKNKTLADVWTEYKGTLYFIDTENKTIIEVEIPKLSFEYKNKEKIE